MHIKTVIYKKSREPSIYYPKPKKLKQDNGRFDVPEGTFFITDTDSFQITKRWIGPFRFQCITYYYNEDVAIPLDFFDLVDTGDKYVVDGEIVDDEEEKPTEDGDIGEEYAIKKIKLNPPSPRMFNEAFTPAFYKMVRGNPKNSKQDIMYILMWAAALLSAYIAWRITGVWNVVKDFVPLPS